MIFLKNIAYLLVCRINLLEWSFACLELNFVFFFYKNNETLYYTAKYILEN